MKKGELFFSILLTIFIVSIPVRTYADTQIVLPSGYAQSEFHDLSRDIGLAISYVPLETSAPLGITGFDVGVEASFVSIHNNDPYWAQAVQTGNAPSTLIVPKLHLDKGLPAGIDIGVIYSSIPNSNVSLLGGELKYAILEGSVATPALAIRGSYTKLNGVSDLELNTAGVDLSISKGFGPLTPFAGIGEKFIRSTATNSALNLSSENINSFNGFVGFKLSMMVVNLVGEADLGELPIYSLRLNVGW